MKGKKKEIERGEVGNRRALGKNKKSGNKSNRNVIKKEKNMRSGRDVKEGEKWEKKCVCTW